MHACVQDQGGMGLSLPRLMPSVGNVARCTMLVPQVWSRLLSHSSLGKPPSRLPHRSCDHSGDQVPLESRPGAMRLGLHQHRCSPVTECGMCARYRLRGAPPPLLAHVPRKVLEGDRPSSTAR